MNSILDYGANPSLQDADGQTALHHCCSGNSKLGPSCAKILIEKDPQGPSFLNKNGKTAFDLIQSMNEDWTKLINAIK